MDRSRDEVRSVIAELKTPDDVLGIPAEWNGGFTDAEFFKVGEVTETMWRYNGDPKRPHACLTSGKCSDGYYDIGALLTYPNVGEILARQLVAKIEKHLDMRIDRHTVDFIVTSDHAGAAISRDVGRITGVRNDFAVKEDVWKWNEQKDLEKVGERQRWTRAGSIIKASGRVLHLEELVTTDLTARRVREGVRKDNPNPVYFFSVLGCIVHRPDPKAEKPTEFEGGEILSLFYLPTNVWEPAVCPLHAAGSEALKPKVGDNWSRLHAA